QAVAGRARLAIDLQPALELGPVIGAERPGKRPVLLHRLLQRIMRGGPFRVLFLRQGRTGESQSEPKRGNSLEDRVHPEKPLSNLKPAVRILEPARRRPAARYRPCPCSSRALPR